MIVKPGHSYVMIEEIVTLINTILIYIYIINKSLFCWGGGGEGVFLSFFCFLFFILLVSCRHTLWNGMNQVTNSLSTSSCQEFVNLFLSFTSEPIDVAFLLLLSRSQIYIKQMFNSYSRTVFVWLLCSF